MTDADRVTALIRALLLRDVEFDELMGAVMEVARMEKLPDDITTQVAQVFAARLGVVPASPEGDE